VDPIGGGRCGRRWLLLAALLATAAEPLHAQLLRLAQGAGEAGVELRGERTKYDGFPGSAATLYAEWFSLPISGVILDPRFLSYSAVLRPAWGQRSASGQPEGNATRNIGLSFSASILPAAPVSLSVQSHRSSGRANTGFGGETSFETGGLGGTLRIRSPAFPMFAEWATRSVNDWWRGGVNQSPLHRDETLQSFRFSGQSSKLSASIERVRFTDHAGVLGYTATTGAFAHGVRWGTGSSLETRGDVSARDGNDTHRRRTLSERIHVQHTPLFATDYTVQWRRSSETGTPSSASSASIGARYRPTRMLTGVLIGTGSSSTYRRGGLTSLTVAPSLVIAARLPAATQLDGSISGAYERTSRRLGDDAWIQAVDEYHDVDASRRFLLLKEAGDVASVVVHNRDHSVAYASGLDYRVTSLGELILITIVPDGRIAVGDAVAVSYRYAAPEAAEHEMRQMTVRAAVTRGGLFVRQSVSLRHGRTLTGGGDDRSGSGDDYITNMGVHVNRSIGRIAADIERRVRLNSRTDFATSELRLGLLPPPLAGLQATASTSLMRTRMNTQELTLVTSNVALNWAPLTSLHGQTSFEYWLWTPRDQPAERFVGWTLDILWRIGQMQTDWRYAYQLREAAPDALQHRFSGRVTRRF
jgi:hypothetical protein